MANEKTLERLQKELRQAKAEVQNHESGSYARNIWKREIKYIQNLIKKVEENK